ncbi:MAG: CotH kinase family protein [Clostridia bacterium]|nr:CotH kinase family protein [Clostridia bacterium]
MRQLSKTEKNSLLKLLAAVMAVILLLPVCLAACTPRDTDTPTENPTSAPTEQPTTAPTEGNTQTPTEPATSQPTEGNTQTPTEPATSQPTEGNTQAPTEPATQAPTEAPTEPATQAPTEAPTEAVGENYDGVVISKVYGNGGKTDGAMSSSFIELYNTSKSTAKLGGIAIYYGEGASFSMLDLSGYEIAPESYLLIKGKTVNGYDTSFEVLRIDNYDIEWAVTIDNKEFELVLAEKDAGITPGMDFEGADGVISYVVANETENVNVNWVHNLSKHRMIVRTELTDTSGYHRINLSSAGTSDLEKILPQYSDGENDYISSNFYEVIFSQEGGVFATRTLSVRLKAPEGWSIYYTLDGSDPREMGVKYTKALSLTHTNDASWGPTINLGISRDPAATPAASTMFGGKVVKAYATNGTDSTAVYTQTYFMSTDLWRLDATVISMSVDKDEMFGSGNVYYDFPLFETRPRARVFIETFDGDGKKQGGSYAEVAVSGNGSSGLPMKSLRVYYKDPTDLNDPALDSLEFDLFEGRAQNSLGQSITSFDRILLRNGGNDFGITMLRDVFCQRMATGLNVDRLEYEPVLVFINGEFWGMYNCRERYSPEYFNRHYGVLEENVAIIENESPLKYDASLPSSWDTDYVATTGDEITPHDMYAKEFNELVEYIRNNDMSLQVNYDYVAERLDISTFIDYWVMNTYFCNPDWPGNNIKVWKNINPDDPSGLDTKWRFLLLDMDSAVAYQFNSDVDVNKFNDIANNTRCGSIMYGLCQNEDFKLQFVTRAYELVNNSFTYKQTSAVLAELAEGIEPLMPYQYERYPSHGNMGAWPYYVDVMYDFLATRTEYYLEQIVNTFGITQEDIENAVPSVRITVSSNTAAATVKVNGEAVSNNIQQFKIEGESASVNIQIQINEGYELKYVEFVGKSGERQTFTSTSFTLTSSESGTLTVTTALSDPVKIVDVEASMLGVFALDHKGDLLAWGANTGNALGISGGGDITSPTLVMSGVKKVATTKGMDTAADASNEFTTAILTKSGKLYTVGSNSSGQLGRTGATDSLGLVSFSGTIVDIALGRDHLLVLDSAGGLWGIGNNSYGQLGSTSFGGNVTSFVKIADNVSRISAGRRNTYYVDKSGNLYGLGDNRWYKITAQSSETKISTPTFMTNNVSDVFGSTHQVLILKNDGSLYYLGQRELSSFNSVSEYRGVMELVHTGVVKADIYYDHIVMLCEGGDVYGYGFNGSYQLGADAGSPVLTATKIAEGAVDIAAGASTTVIVLEDGSVIVSGSNARGQAGNGATVGSADMATVEFPYIK